MDGTGRGRLVRAGLVIAAALAGAAMVGCADEDDTPPSPYDRAVEMTCGEWHALEETDRIDQVGLLVSPGTAGSGDVTPDLIAEIERDCTPDDELLRTVVSALRP